MKQIIPALLLALSAPAFASPAASMQLAMHPECYVIGGQVMVRGAVVEEGTDAPVEGARVKLAYGDETLFGRTNAEGIYVATGKVNPAAHEIREIGTWVHTLGMLVWQPATSFPGSCRPAVVNVGPILGSKP